MRTIRFELWLATTAVVVAAAGVTLPAHAAQLGGDRREAPVVARPADAAIAGAKTAAATDTGTPDPADPAAAQSPPAPVADPPPAPPAGAAELTADQRVGEKIRELFAGRIERIIDRRSRAAAEAFYAARAYAPLWVENGTEDDRARAAAAYLAGVGADGLDPADYPVPSFADADPGALAEAELKMTAAVLTYARHAQLGRVHYSRVGADIAYDQAAPDAGAELGQLADATDVAAVLDGYNPPHEGYRALKAKLAEVRGRSGDPRLRLAQGRVLKPGMDDPRVPALRQRLGLEDTGAGTTYDGALSDAVKAFQRQHDLAATGVLTAATVDALNGPRRDREADLIIANMERWRWMPRDLGSAYVEVNIPDYTLKVVDHGAVVWTTKIVAGKPGEKATPLLSETMKYITVNPTWNVPPSIINNEYLPALAQDPTVLERMGLKLDHNRDGSVHIYQPPGDGNALGRLRFNFPNKFLVYQHDTPDKHLFAQARRAYSHGCMRVQYPDKYAEVLLGIANPKDGYTADKIHRMYGTGERDIHLTTPIPVHLTYQTAFVDAAGRLETRSDVYGRDAKVLAALKGDERRVADVAVEHRETGGTSSVHRPVARVPAAVAAPVAYPPQPFGGPLFGGLFH